MDLAAYQLSDLHSHTTRCGHATGTMREYVERARAAGLREFGFSEHSPWMVVRRDQWLTMRRDELPGYVEEVQQLAREFNTGGVVPFTLRLGLEMDYVPSRMDEARAAMAGFPWDYLIGSVHHLGFWGLPSPEDAEYYDRVHFEDLADIYFETMACMVRERYCDFVSHMDVIKRFGHALPNLLPWVEPLIPLLRANEIAVEINTSGYDHPVAAPYPGWDLIEALHAGGVRLLINSDSHAPEHVARHFDKVIPELLKRNITRLVRFERREMREYSIALPA